jgi:CBS domain containing-hemolysin-like protein
VISVVIAYVLITFSQSTVGEIVPKLYTIQHAEGALRRIARPLRFSRMLFTPFIFLLQASSNWMLRLIGVDPEAEPEGGTPEEIKRIIAQSQMGGTLDAGEATMLTGVFHLHEQEARQVMTPIPAVVTVDVSQTVNDALRLCI